MNFVVFVSLVIVQVSRLVFAAEGNYFFRDQDNWATDDNDCGKEENSPIDIIDDDVIHDSKLDEPFMWSDNFLDKVEKLSCKNVGQSYQCDVGSTATTKRTVSGGNLIKTPLKLLQFHVHFGSSSRMEGSEHRVNGHQYPAEIHFVFLSDGLSGFSQYGDLAVWGFFIDIAGKGYNAQGSLDIVLETISNNLWEYDADGTGKNLDGQIDLSEIIPVTNYHSMGSFYRYKGGLTTPGCNQVVQWTVFQNPLYISGEQYNRMTEGKSWPNSEGEAEDMIDNFRKPQPLNGRPVTATKFAMQGMNKRINSGNEQSSRAAFESSFCAVLALVVAKVMAQ